MNIFIVKFFHEKEIPWNKFASVNNAINYASASKDIKIIKEKDMVKVSVSDKGHRS